MKIHKITIITWQIVAHKTTCFASYAKKKITTVRRRRLDDVKKTFKCSLHILFEMLQTIKKKTLK